MVPLLPRARVLPELSETPPLPTVAFGVSVTTLRFEEAVRLLAPSASVTAVTPLKPMMFRLPPTRLTARAPSRAPVAVPVLFSVTVAVGFTVQLPPLDVPAPLIRRVPKLMFIAFTAVLAAVSVRVLPPTLVSG